MRIRIMVLCALSVTACSITLPVTPPEPDAERDVVVRTARAVAAPTARGAAAAGAGVRPMMRRNRRRRYGHRLVHRETLVLDWAHLVDEVGRPARLPACAARMVIVLSPVKRTSAGRSRPPARPAAWNGAGAPVGTGR